MTPTEKATLLKPRHTRFDTDRHGNPRWYTIDCEGRKVRMREEPGSEAWLMEWRVIRSRPPRPKTTHRQTQLAASRAAGKSPYRDPEDARQRHVERDLIHLTYRAKMRARGKAVDFTLQPEDVIVMLRRQGYRCKLTGIAFMPRRSGLQNGGRSPYAVSIDRVVPHLGYTRDNVRLVVSAVNIAMLDWGEAVFATIAHAYASRWPV